MPISNPTGVHKAGSAAIYGDVGLVAGSNITLEQNATAITIASSGGSGTPGGADTNIQYNDGGSFGGTSYLSWIEDTKTLALTGTATLQLAGTANITISQPQAIPSFSLNQLATANTTIAPTLVSNVVTLTDGDIDPGSTILWRFLGQHITGNSSPSTQNFIKGVDYDYTLTRTNAQLPPTIAAVNFQGRYDNTSGQSADTFVLADFNFENISGTLTNLYGMRFNPPTVSAGSVVNFTALRIEDCSGEEVFHAVGSTDTARFRSNVIIGTAGAITSGIKMDLVGRFRTSVGLSVASTVTSNTINIGGNAARTIFMDRHTTNNTAGQSLTITAGGATSGATDKNGGALILQTGVATGSSIATQMRFQTPHGSATTGTTDISYVNRVIINGMQRLQSGATAAILTIALGTAEMASGLVDYSVDVSDGTDFIADSGTVYYAAVNKAGTRTTTANITGSAVAKSAAGDTIVNSFGFTNRATAVALHILSTVTGLTPTIYRVTYKVTSGSYQNVHIE